MKKNNRFWLVCLSLVMTLGLALNANGQVFITDGDESNRVGMSESDFNVMVGSQDYNGDQYVEYTPLGEGFLLLTCLGSVYLLRKRRKASKQG